MVQVQFLSAPTLLWIAWFSCLSFSVNPTSFAFWHYSLKNPMYCDPSDHNFHRFFCWLDHFKGTTFISVSLSPGSSSIKSNPLRSGKSGCTLFHAPPKFLLFNFWINFCMQVIQGSNSIQPFLFFLSLVSDSVLTPFFSLPLFFLGPFNCYQKLSLIFKLANH